MAVETLAENPARCPVIPETSELGYTLHHLFYGKGRGIYRIIFHIREEDRHVWIVRIWHGSRDNITAEDVQD